MADQYKAILQELIGTALNIPDGELQKLFTKTDEELTDTERATLITDLKGKFTKHLESIMKTGVLNADKKYQAGERSAFAKIEKQLRDAFNVEDANLTGQDLIDAVLDQSTEAAKKTSTLTTEEIKKHPVYLKAEQEFKKQLKTATDDADKKVKELEGKQAKKETFDKVGAKAMEIFEAMNPVLSDDPAKATAQKSIVTDKLSGYEFELIDKQFIPMKDGKRLEDQFGHAMDLDKLVKDIVTPVFDFHVAEKRESPSAKVPKPGDRDYVDPKKQQQSSYKGPLPKTDAEWQKAMDDDKLSIDDKKAINEHWSKEKAKGQPA